MTVLNPIKLVQYGDYVLDNVISCTTNFTDISDSYSNVADADGAFDNQLTSRGLQAKGAVTASMMLVADSTKIMRQKRDTLLRMLGKGPQPLWYMPETSKLGPRWCRARITKIQMDESADDVDRMQEVQLTWSVGMPRWFSRPAVNNPALPGYDQDYPSETNQSYYMGFNSLFGVGQNFSVIRTETQVTPGQEVTVVNNGNAPTPLLFQFRGSRPWDLSEGLMYGDPGVFIGGYGSATVQWPTVTHKNDWGLTLNKFQWQNTLQVNEILEVNGSSGRVTLYNWPNFNQSGFNNFVVQSGLGILILEPGSNVIKVDGVFSGPFAHLILDWEDAWF